MVFGNLNDQSASGVIFSRNPDTGEDKIKGEFLLESQGEDGVSGCITPKNISETDIDDAFVYSLDDLEQVALQGRQEREAVAAEAWQIVDSEVEKWLAGRAVREVVPT